MSFDELWEEGDEGARRSHEPKREPGDDAFEDSIDWDTMAEVDLAMELREDRLRSQTFKPDKESLAGFPYNAITKVHHYTAARMRALKRGPIEAIPTPFPTINRMMFNAGGRIGLARGWHTVIGGAPNRGKSTLALNFAVGAIRHGWKVLYIALEADIEDIGTRAMSMASGIPLKQLTRGRDYDFERDRQAAEFFLDLPGGLYLNRVPVYTVEHIVEVVEAWRKWKGVVVFILDHMQLATTGDERGLAAQSAEISKAMNSLAKEHRMVSIGLSQLTTGASREKKSPPSMYHLLGGTPLVADADQIFVIDHSEKSWKPNIQARETDVTLLHDKNRHGPTGTIPIRFEWRTNRVVELAELGNAGVPVPVPEPNDTEPKPLAPAQQSMFTPSERADS